MPIILKSESKLNYQEHKTAIDLFLKEQQLIGDSIKIEILQNSGNVDYEIASQKIKPFDFDPNKLPIEAWKKMGFTDKQIRTIKKYESKGGKFKRKEDLKKIYSISDIEYGIIEPYIKIPSAYKSKTGKIIKKKKGHRKVKFKNVEINNSDSLELINSLGLSPWLAKRTIAYKRLLGGFHNISQLKEVYGMSDSIFNSIQKYITIDTNELKKIDINRIEFKELLRHPYFDYNTTKSLFKTRNKIGSFSNMGEIKMVNGINDSIYNKVYYYLYIRR